MSFNISETLLTSSFNNFDNHIDAICVLNKYICIKTPVNLKVLDILKNTPVPENLNLPTFLETKEDSLLVFFNYLFSSILKNWYGLPDLTKYFDQSSLNYKRF